MVQVGARAVAAAALLMALAIPAHASLLEEQTGGFVSYQFDAGTGHDAPDSCQQADPAWSLPANGRTDGMLVAGDDQSDVFVVEVPPALVGSPLIMTVHEPDGAPDLAVTALVPGCVTDVLDLTQQPAPPPSPPQPAAGERQVAATRLDDPYRCDDSIRTFVLTGLDGSSAPASIHAAWSNGQQATVPLAGSTREFAVYRTADHLAYTLDGVWANVPAAWAGHFMLVQGPCMATDGGAIYGEPAALLDDGIAFTPLRAGRYAVAVSFSGDGPAPSASAPMTCHLCFAPLEGIAGSLSYELSSESREPSSPDTVSRLG